MIRILHTIDTTGPGGAETVFVNLVGGLDKKRFQSFAAIHGPGWVYDSLLKKGIHTLSVKSSGPFDIKYLYQLLRIIKDYKIDVIQSHLMGSNLYCSIAGMIFRIPVISTFHGYVDKSENERYSFIKRNLINMGSNKIVFVSNHLRSHFVNQLFFSQPKSMTIYNGVDSNIFYPKKSNSIRAQLGIGPENLVVGAVGNIRPAKRYDLFLKAARIVYKKRPDCRFIVAGQVSGRLYYDLLKLRKDLGLTETFFFVGFQADAAKVFHNIDIFLLSSSSEGFSISTLESMFCGVPVVATRSGGPEEIVKNKKNGLLVECNEKKIAEGILELANNSYLYNTIKSNNLKSISYFNMQTMIKKYESIYSI
jgi:glycosyltransferase involved in cell wall biosynthesis